MSTNPDHFRPRVADGSQQYLDSTIRTASPAKLRLMLILRAIEVAETLSAQWRNQASLGSNEHSLKLLDLLNELLSGVTKGATESETAVCQTVADLYVFLVKHLLVAEKDSDALKIDEIRIVLETEAETWKAVCAAESTPAAMVRPAAPAAESSFSGLNFQA